MHYFDYLKALIIAAALVVLSAFTITTHASETVTRDQLPAQASARTAPQQHDAWTYRVWDDLFVIGERMLEGMPMSYRQNFVERYPYFEPDNTSGFDNSLVLKSRSGEDRSL